MKSVSRLIKKIEKMIALSMKSDVYTIKFSNKNPTSVGRTIQIIQEMAQNLDIEKLSIWPSLKEIQKYGDLEHPYDLRRLYMGIIFKDAGFFTFSYTDPIITEAIVEPPKSLDTLNTHLAIVDYNGSIDEIEVLTSEINMVFEKYLDDSITIERNDLPLKELQIRLQFTQQDFAKQLPWLETFQDAMLDDVSKKSFAHFLRERIKAQLLAGTYNLYPVMPPSFRDEWINARIVQFLSFPTQYTPKEAVANFIAFNEEIKPIESLPSLKDACGQPTRWALFHPFILEQYGIPKGCEVQKDAIVIDAGGSTGDTALYFSEKIEGDLGKIYVFEPIMPAAEAARQNCKLNKRCNIDIIPMALSDENEQLHFAIPEGVALSGARRSDKATEYSAEAIRLDSFVQQNNIPSIDFIKMDIEGAEMAALEGAKETIRRFKPDCAICVYHKKNDYWDIPHFLLEQCPEYKFYFRCDAEPVLFATVRQAK